MIVYVLANIHTPSRVAGVIVSQDAWTCYDTCRAVEERIRAVYQGTEIVWDSPERQVSFTTGGATPYRSGFLVSIVGEEDIGHYATPYPRLQEAA